MKGYEYFKQLLELEILKAADIHNYTNDVNHTPTQSPGQNKSLFNPSFDDREIHLTRHLLSINSHQ